MRFIYTLLLVALVAALRGENVGEKPQSYYIAFSASALPSGTVIVSLSLEIETKGVVGIQRLPVGWSFQTRSSGARKTTVIISKSKSVRVKGAREHLPIVALSRVVSIRAKQDDQNQPMDPPDVKGFVEIAQETDDESLERVELNAESIHLIYEH